MCEHDFWCQKFKFINKTYSGPSGEDLILTWSVGPLDSQRYSLLSWSHECIHWRNSETSSCGKKKKASFLSRSKRWGALEEHKGRATQRQCFRQDDGRWEFQRTDLNLGSWHLVGPMTCFPGGSDGKESTCNVLDPGSIPGLGRSPGGNTATHASIPAWSIPWREELGGLQSMGSQRVRHDWATKMMMGNKDIQNPSTSQNV